MRFISIPVGFRRRLPLAIGAVLLTAVAIAIPLRWAGTSAAENTNLSRAAPRTVTTCGDDNAAMHRPATASDIENAGLPAPAAVDGDTGTRWSSAFSDPQWLQVDLGTTRP